MKAKGKNTHSHTMMWISSGFGLSWCKWLLRWMMNCSIVLSIALKWSDSMLNERIVNLEFYYICHTSTHTNATTDTSHFALISGLPPILAELERTCSIWIEREWRRYPNEGQACRLAHVTRKMLIRHSSQKLIDLPYNCVVRWLLLAFDNSWLSIILYSFGHHQATAN